MLIKNIQTINRTDIIKVCSNIAPDNYRLETFPQ